MTANADQTQVNLALAAAAGRGIFDDPEKPVAYEPQGEAECQAAVTALGEAFAAAGGTIAAILENARAAAGVLSDDRLQGLSEIVQNADDAGATRVLFRQTSQELIAVHDGAPLTLKDVHALAAPWLTTKRAKAAATGRFGIGLLTLHSLAPAFELHGGDYHLRLGDPTVEALPATDLARWHAAPSDTVVIVPLAPGALLDDEILKWCASWDDSSLLFLRTVREVSFCSGDQTRRLRLDVEEQGVSSCEIAGCLVDVQRRHVSAPDDRTWLTYSTDMPSPAGLYRSHKVTEPTTPVAVAMPGEPRIGGYLSAGLPVMRTRLPMHANAQFDPVASRQGLAESDWNSALAALVAELWTTAVVDVFATSPAATWHLVPLPMGPTASGRAVRPGIVEQLEELVAEAAIGSVATSAALPVGGAHIPVTDLAIEDVPLQGLLTAAETAALANRQHALPAECRDGDGRWRQVLDHWRRCHVPLPAAVTVADALPLTEDPSREVSNTIALAAAAITSGLGAELSARRCIVLADGTRVKPLDQTRLRVLVADAVGLAETLGMAVRLNGAYFHDEAPAMAVVGWLRDQGSVVDSSDDQAVLARLATAGRSGHRLGRPLTDAQVVALRDALEILGQTQWERLGPDIGRAIVLDAVQYDTSGKTQKTTACPAEAYQPKAVDRESDSFAFAADSTPGLRWLAARYAKVLRSSMSRAGLGPQRFLRLLGAENAPRLVPHPGLYHRFDDRRMGLPSGVTGSPRGRRDALQDLGATHSLDDMHSPDLQLVLRHIGQERRALRRRSRANAIIAVLGRSWPHLAEYAQVQAADDYYTWQIKGPIRAWWLWAAGDTAWLDDQSSAPSKPLRLRQRTDATLAVHGVAAPGYLHPAFARARPEVLTALGVAGEPDTRSLVNRLQDLRDRPDPECDLDAETAVVYRALASRMRRRNRSSAEVTPQRLRQLFASGTGLIWVRTGWKSPPEVLRGEPVFGRYRVFAPQVPDTENLWQMLQVRLPDLDDCLGVLRDVAKEKRNDAETQGIVLDVLRLMVRLLAGKPADERQTRQLAKTPLLTSHGWSAQRPVLAVDDPSLARVLGERLPVWEPGGELAQFAALLSPLRLHQLDATQITIMNVDDAYPDDEATGLFGEAVGLLHEDLIRNDPAAASSLRIDWNRLRSVEVNVCPDLQVRVDGLPEGEAVIVAVSARLVPDAGVLYVSAPGAMAQVDGGGRAVAAFFVGDRRRLAQAWLAAVAEAQAGRSAVALRQASERAAEEQAASEAAIAERLAALRLQAQQRRTTKTENGAASRPTPGQATATDSSSTGSPAGRTTPDRQRVLVDPASLVVVDPEGRITLGGATPSTGQAPRRRSPLPEPKPGGHGPRERSGHRAYTDLEKETVGLELVRKVLGGDAQDMVDLRAQHNVGADAIDELRQFYELKVYSGAEPDHVVLENSQIRRAMSTRDFFLVVVSGLEGDEATPRVRVIVHPLAQLRMSETSRVMFHGIRQSHSLVYDLKPSDDAKAQ
ncbi:sacsin N-terminal ATP-binding-like domain-containing protein [Micromonospora palomenae]|uniref:sacsin N-terminal ATP-binding-like domain-containing protein n=1 Tax=Micromonospora palomenae TaxID=1461247 RepID=UPI003F88A3EF